ncbi:hypothetical protein F4604DRAFT_1906577 [Suillus subluteus]|nr:hypothetical protein F4604DRAFT_1906577 [Suillus subluteus]
MKELEDATGIDARALVTFHPGMSGAREKLQWASKRVTTLQEDIAYSLFGIFGITLPVIYGEKKQNALGRLLQEIVAQSGDITVLNWVGQPSEFNSCLPAHITSYTTPPRTITSLPEDRIQTIISSLRKDPVAVDFALKLYNQLDNTSAARFANHRLHLPCITFRVTDISLSYGPSQETQYEVKADGLCDLLITTKEPIVQFSRTWHTQQTFVLVRPWDRYLLELPDFAHLLDDMESETYWTPPPSPSDDSPSRSLVKQEVVDLESRALQLLVRLGQPFGAFLLARQRGGEYKRVVSDCDIVAQVIEDMTSVRDLMDIRTIEILDPQTGVRMSTVSHEGKKTCGNEGHVFSAQHSATVDNRTITLLDDHAFKSDLLSMMGDTEPETNDELKRCAKAVLLKMGSTIASIGPHGVRTSELLDAMMEGPEKASLSSGVRYAAAAIIVTVACQKGEASYFSASELMKLAHDWFLLFLWPCHSTYQVC